MADRDRQDVGKPAADLLPEPLTMEAARAAAAGCRACELWQKGTQTVFGEGSPPCAAMLVGEQPGDREDVEGHPFVGPAGELLDRALTEAGLARDEAYVTNVVKHFRWVPQGRRRLHQKPDEIHVAACRPWLEAEVELVKPRLLVLLGATAAQGILGPHVRVLKQRGEVHPTPFGVPAMITVHPSSVLRAPDPESRERAYADFVADLARAVQRLAADSRD
ncbi:MAG: UdgX family uracil-DNA binding protein [Candidatus Dormibacteraeota bacterium]|nr:UdgX family uracil-DNA binding protein [Candidatus Dormibacteraeota bacterium]